MATGVWVNRTGTNVWSAPGFGDQIYININGTSPASWQIVDEMYVNTNGSNNWEQVWPELADPSFGTMVFRSGNGTGSPQVSDMDEGCLCDYDPSKNFYANEWCWRWNVNDCVGTAHRIQAQRNLSTWLDHGSEWNACKLWLTITNCAYTGYDGMNHSGQNLTTACTVWNHTTTTPYFRFKLGTIGMGTVYETSSQFTLSNCVVA